MINRELVNITDLSIRRASRGAGGDVGTPAAVYVDLEATQEPSNQLIKTADGREVRLSAVIWIDHVDADGEEIDVRVGDFLSWTNRLGQASGDREVLQVLPYVTGSELDHLQIGV